MREKRYEVCLLQKLSLRDKPDEQPRPAAEIAGNCRNMQGKGNTVVPRSDFCCRVWAGPTPIVVGAIPFQNGRQVRHIHGLAQPEVRQLHVPPCIQQQIIWLDVSAHPSTHSWYQHVTSVTQVVVCAVHPGQHSSSCTIVAWVC